MNNTYDENQGQGPVIYPEPPREHVYYGNQGFATVSLVMGILALISMCCFPPMGFFFGGLGILFGILSKGTYTRPGNAKAGIVLSSVGLAIAAAVVIFACALMLSDSRGKNFLGEYFDILMHPEEYTEEDLYDFIEDYMYPEDGSDIYDREDILPFGDDTDDYPGSERDYYTPEQRNDDVI